MQGESLHYNRISSHSLQQDFIDLEIEMGLQNASDDTALLHPAIYDDDSDQRAAGDHICDPHSMEISPSVMDQATISANSVSIDSHELTESIEERSVQMIPEFIVQEPVRLVRPGENQKPRRFYRTFWRGISKRAFLREIEREFPIE